MLPQFDRIEQQFPKELPVHVILPKDGPQRPSGLIGNTVDDGEDVLLVELVVAVEDIGLDVVIEEVPNEETAVLAA